MKRILSLFAGVALSTVAFAQSNERGTYKQGIDSYPSANRQSSAYSSRTSRNQLPAGVRPLNKASNLLGTTVRDSSGQNIGEVWDIVIDFNSGRVAYLVVNVSGELDTESGLIAVPARSIRLTGNRNAVVLNAGRNQIEQLQSFSEERYPAIRNQAARPANARTSVYQDDYTEPQNGNNRRTDWQAPSGRNDPEGDWYFYEWFLVPEPTTQANSGTDRSSKSGSGKLGQGGSGQSQSGDSDTDQSAAQQFNLPDSDSGSSRNLRSNSSTQLRQSGGDGEILSGWIREIDPETRTLIVEGQDKTLQFKLAKDVTIKKNGRGSAGLDDLEPGQRVDVAYHYQNGANRAFTVNEHTAATIPDSTSQESEFDYFH